MTENSRPLSDDERALLERTARSRTATHGLVTRAKIVLDCADAGVGEAARRSAVSPVTATKWWTRFLESGLDGLADSPRRGRPGASDADVAEILRHALIVPPDGARRWSTRTVAADTGLSQATVSRVRRRHFPQPEPGTRVLSDTTTSILNYVDVSEHGCALGFVRTTNAPIAGTPSPALVDAVETIACAALLRRPHDGYPAASAAAPSSAPGPSDSPTPPPRALPLLRRTARHLTPVPPVTLLIDVPLDDAAHRWLTDHPGLTVRVLTPGEWLAAVHRIAETLDSRQLTELKTVQHRIREAYRAGESGFCWVRDTASPDPSGTGDAAGTAAPAPGTTTSSSIHDPIDEELTRTVVAVCAAIDDGELWPGDEIPVRTVTRRSGLSAGRVGDALGRLAAEALIERCGGRFLVPRPVPRDVVETYTARGLLGTAVARRLASMQRELPPSIDAYLERLDVCDRMGLTHEAAMIDLDFQNELARASEMPRIGWMFVQLSLQLRLFVTIIGLDYRYPTEEIAGDGRRLVDACRAQDPEAAVAAWRAKTDNCARFMLEYLETSTARRQDRG
ncbi:MAG: FCD domain-containing protein [Gordonia sp. (in: high G+C Gram-positive bacteria)]|uniref:FCD domain-containing protein n=1 Tax=Gordonia sp. (in: high G+C Gram-positive bacteria) TaxID=84139 RepID=UPI0039E5B645